MFKTSVLLSLDSGNLPLINLFDIKYQCFIKTAPQFLLKPFIVLIGLNNRPIIDHLFYSSVNENEAGGDLFYRNLIGFLM